MGWGLEKYIKWLLGPLKAQICWVIYNQSIILEDEILCVVVLLFVVNAYACYRFPSVDGI